MVIVVGVLWIFLHLRGTQQIFLEYLETAQLRRKETNNATDLLVGKRGGGGLRTVNKLQHAEDKTFALRSDLQRRIIIRYSAETRQKIGGKTYL